ncbi:MAG TPA: DNA gyrase inhibitor YacG [Steroidobacteraceae bacterium]|nr:DNA gyrase inhibitor YacG [Steroidobacteraceae bacterium]
MSSIRVRCPTCRRELEWDTAPFRPFCSERCRLIDLGAWLTEQRVIPGDTDSGAETDPTPTDEPPQQGTS